MASLDQADAFLATYKRYKEDTEYIAAWLASTAKDSGYEGVRSQKAPKPKNKKGKNKKPNRQVTTNAKYIISISEFVPMAQKIAEASADVLVPVALSKVFNNAISTRRKVSNWFRAAAHTDDESNKRHHYFITVLEDAFRVLRPHIAVGLPKTARATAKDAGSSAQLSMENRFAKLTVEEIAELAEESGADIEALPEVAKVVLQQDETELEEELFFAVRLFLLELQDMRAAVNETWEKYKSGEVDLVVPGLVSKEAVNLVKKAETSFDLFVRRPKQYPATTYSLPFLAEELWKPKDSEDGASAKNVNVERDVPFEPVYAGLKLCLDEMKTFEPKGKRHLPVVEPKPLGATRVHHHTRRALEYAQVIRLTMFGNRPKVLGSSWEAVIDMFTKKELSVSTVFAVQLQLDAQDVLGDQRNLVTSELLAHLKHLIMQYNIEEEYPDPFLPNSLRRHAYENFNTFLRDCNRWNHEGGFDDEWRKLMKNPRVASHKMLKTLRNEKDYMYSQQPSLVAELKHLLYAEWHAAGMRLESQCLSICMMAHIYVRGLLANPVARSWPDMEILLFAQNPEWLFYGGRPKTLLEHFQRFGLAFGGSATLYAKDLSIEKMLKTAKQRMRKTNFHELRDSSAFGDGVFHRGNNGEIIGGGNALYENILERLFKLSRPSNAQPQPWGRLARCFLHSQGQEPGIGKKSMSAADILRDLARWVQADTTDLFFDWVYMKRNCDLLWAAIDNVLRAEHGDWPGMGEGMALELALEIICNERFLITVTAFIQETIHQDTTRVFEPPCNVRGDACLTKLTTYHRLSAKNFVLPGPLNFRKLLEGDLPGPMRDIETESGEKLRLQGLEYMKKEQHPHGSASWRDIIDQVGDQPGVDPGRMGQILDALGPDLLTDMYEDILRNRGLL